MAGADDSFQLSIAVEAMGVTDRHVVGRAMVVVAVGAVIATWVHVKEACLRDFGGCRGGAGGAHLHPRDAIVHSILVVDGVHTDQELITFTNAPAKSRRDAGFANAAAAAIVVGLRSHQGDAKRRRLAGPGIDVADDASVTVIADGERNTFSIDKARHFVNLIDDTAGRATTEQHRRGTT